MTGTRSRGLFVTFEGIDGSGKSTQAALLSEYLRSCEHETVLTREPGGSEGAEKIRSLLVEGEPGRWSPETEILLFTAARRDHLERLIAPALERGANVICDRFVDSTHVYQGIVRKDLAGTVDRLHQMMIGMLPDQTFFLDVEPEYALARADARASREDRFEAFGLEFQKRLRVGFLDLARQQPDRIVTIDGTGSADTVQGRIRDAFGQTCAPK